MFSHKRTISRPSRCCPDLLKGREPRYNSGPVMIQPIELGRFRIFPLLEGYFKLDGGGMFGPVPKTLWSKLYPSDDQNRIRLAIRPLLVEAGSQWILIDTGDGDKWDAKWKRNYGIELLSTLD